MAEDVTTANHDAVGTEAIKTKGKRIKARKRKATKDAPPNLDNTLSYHNM